MCEVDAFRTLPSVSQQSTERMSPGGGSCASRSITWMRSSFEVRTIRRGPLAYACSEGMEVGNGQ